MNLKYALGRTSRLAVLGSALAVTAVPASAATVYAGGGFLAGFAGCAAHGWDDAQSVTVRFQPAGMPQNDPDMHTIVMQIGEGTQVYQFAGSVPIGQWADVDYWTIWSNAPGLITDPRVRLRVIGWASDPIVDENDLEGRFHGLIENFDAITGCTARFGLSVQRDD